MSTNNNIDIKEFLKTYFQIEKEILSKEEFKEEINKKLK